MTQNVTNIAAKGNVPSIVEESIPKIGNMATLPAVAHKIMVLVENPESSMEDLNKLIASDSALTARILKVVNSSFYGMPQQIGTIDHALVMLGMDAIKSIATAASLSKVFQSNQIIGDFDARNLWTHSIAVATGARELATKVAQRLADEAFLAGLIHDIGILVEMQACRPKFVELIELLSNEQNLTFREAEEQVLGATHESFGAGLCRAWKFPTNLECVAGFHHQPMQLPEADRTLPAIVYVADVLAAQIGEGYTRTVETETADSEVLSWLKLSEADLEVIATNLPEAIQESQQLLSDG